jgi:hypothetical protein
VHFGVPAVPQTYNAVQAHRAGRKKRGAWQKRRARRTACRANGNTPAEGQIMLVSNDELATANA